MSLILLIVVVIIFLVIIGIGWDTFFAGIIKGIDKISNISTITNNTRDTFDGDVSKSSKDNISSDSSI